jgi:hypothetical protein
MGTPYVQVQIPAERLERICRELEAFRRSDEVNTDNAVALADLLEEIVAPHVFPQRAECSGCEGDFAPDELESTYCGSFCRKCLVEHLGTCEICREGFR